MASKPREVFFTGAFPLYGAANVFQAIAQHVGELAPRYPDGEQIGWASAQTRTLPENPALEEYPGRSMNPGGPPTRRYRLKPGMTAKDLKLGPYGYASNAEASYAEFKRLKKEGTIPAGTRFQATLPGPGWVATLIDLPPEELFPICAAATGKEVESIAKAIPHEELTIHIDVAMDVEHEEWRRRPWAFEPSNHLDFDWTQEQIAECIALVANGVPSDVELGFHICSIWHHDPSAGQDNEVLVDTANALSKHIKRPIGYIHVPILPEHDKPSDYWAFRNLKLHTETKLYLGLVNLSDGLEGGRRRIQFAERAGGLADFGIGFFCGVGRKRPVAASPSQTTPRRDTPEMTNPRHFRATDETIGEMLDLHRAIAEL